MPVVTLFSSPNGLPMATTTSPTATCVESANSSGCSADDGRVDVENREVGRGVDADDGGVVGLAVREPHLGGVGALDDVGVRDHVTGVVDDEAGALRLGRARSRRALRLRPGS